MAISETDLKLLKAERMTDFSDGGGKMTANEVVDGEVNNLFNDISQLDRTYGRVSLRKAFATVQTENTDTYLGAHIILTDPPDDPNVNVTLYSTESWTDERDAARNYIENYSVEGPESRWVVYGDQIVGQKLVALYSRSNTTNLFTPASDPSPEIGDIMLLSTEKAGYDPNYQYVRVTKINSRETQKFTDGNGDFFKDVLILEIANPLRYTFYGNSVPLRLTSSAPTLFRETSIADAAEYFGVKKITEALSISDLTIKVGSPYTAIVPSAQAETPLIDIAGNMTRPNYVQSGNAAALTASATLSGGAAPDYAANLYLGRGFLPGSLALTIGGTAYKDDGAGGIVLSTGGAGAYGGLVDYAAGSVMITKASSWSSVSVSATATPAAVVYDNAGTVEIPITINNRAFNYVQTLSPVPAPGSLVIDYKALDKWYRLYDDGLGHLSGAAPGIGSGTVNYATGSVLVTLAAMPDIDSSVLFAWTTPNDYTQETYVAEQPKPGIGVTLTHTPIVPGSLTISWNDGTAKTATAAANGTLSGHATGRLVAANGELVFFPSSIPPSGTTFTFEYDQSSLKQDVFSVTGDSGGTVSVTLTQTPVKPGSVKLTFTVKRPKSDHFFINNSNAFPQPDVDQTIVVTDDGDGGFNNDYTGTIDYATGAVTLDTTKPVDVNKVIGFTSQSGWAVAGGTSSQASYKPQFDKVAESETLPAGTTLTAQYALDGATPTAKTENASLTQLRIDLSTATANALVAGSLKFGFAGSEFIDRQGSIYRNHSATTDAATLSGSIDYQTGIVTLTGWAGGSPTLTIAAAASARGINTVSGVTGRAPGAPLATGQFQIQCTAADGTLISVSADNNGDIDEEWAIGHIDWTTGIYHIAYGKFVLDSAIPADVKASSGWYDEANVGIDGKIWVPRLVKPETILFNTVLISYIPLDADILGVDTVRLPQDGRVPIFRVGNVAVVHNTQTLTLPNPVTAGSVHDCERTLLSYAKVFDADGLIVPTSKYTADLDAGTVTMSDPLDLTGYVQPLKIEHRIEDMALVTDVQITGEIKLMKPIRHAYPANTSFLSSALVIGDMQARVTNLFDQQTWANEFSDTLSGSASGASFNDVLYPIDVTNAGAIQERWAIVFTGSTAFNCYGEYSGLIASGTTGDDFEPLNPITGVPYFSLNPLGWGSGWAAGNVLRFNTIAANYPIWLARTTLQSDPAVYTDHFKLQIRGDAN
jgi:hypothetical protein